MMDIYLEFLQKHYILSIIWLFLFISLIITIFKEKLSQVKMVTTDYAVRLINDHDAHMIDLRDVIEYKKGHVVNAISYPFSLIKEKKYSDIENLKDTIVVLVCNNGMTSYQAGNMLVAEGFNDVYVVSGGIPEIKAKNIPLIT